MSHVYQEVYDRMIKRSKWNGECLESTYKIKTGNAPKVTFKKKSFSTPRISWMFHYGNIPNGMLICHKCDNPKCFRIEHLFLGTHKDNIQDMIKKGRDNLWGKRKYTKEQLENAKELRVQGYSFLQISRILNVTKSGISAYLTRHKIKKEFSIPNGRNENVKYSKEFKEKVILMKNQGIRPIDIQKNLNISESTYYDIVYLGKKRRRAKKKT